MPPRDERRYLWRQLAQEQRKQLLTWRRQEGRPWHSPPRSPDLEGQFHLTAACYEHAPIVGSSVTRMNEFTEDLLEVLARISHTVNEKRAAFCGINSLAKKS